MNVRKFMKHQHRQKQEVKTVKFNASRGIVPQQNFFSLPVPLSFFPSFKYNGRLNVGIGVIQKTVKKAIPRPMTQTTNSSA